MKKFFSGLSIFIILITVACLWFFRSLPAGELWNGYSVLYVPGTVSDSLVLEELDASGVKEITCLSNQYLPLDLKADSCEVSLISLNPMAVDYLTRRNNYFFDKSGQYRLYYVPVFYKAKLSQAVSSLNRKTSGGDCGVDSKTSYPFLIPAFALIFAVLLFCFSNKKILYGFLTVIPVLYTFSFPYLSSEIGVLLVLTVLFLISNIFGRRDFVKILVKKYVFMVLLFSAVISSFSSGFVTGFVFMLLLLSEAFIFYIYRSFKIISYKKNRFNPVMIRSSFSVKQYSGKENIIFGVLIFFTVAAFIFSLSTGGNVSEKENRLSFPSVSASQKSENLPSLKDYYYFDYSVKSFPYISLNNSKNNDVHISRFQKEGDKIVQYSDILEYSEAYEESVYNKIDLLQFNAFEKIMKKQGAGFSAGYASNGSHRLNLFCIIISFLQFSVILIYFAWILINKKPRKGRGLK